MFQRHIMYVLQEVLEQEVMIYLNNILIVSPDEEEYYKKTEKILELLTENNLHQKKEKCKYFQKQIKFLRFILMNEKIGKNSEKLKCIHN